VAVHPAGLKRERRSAACSTCSGLSQSGYRLSSNERLCVQQTDGGRDVVDWNRTGLNKGERVSWGDGGDGRDHGERGWRIFRG
jgi:hypothetical protein